MKKKTVRKTSIKKLDHTVVRTLRFNRSDVVLRPSLFGLGLSMKDFNTQGESGEPALPRKMLRVALPKGHAVKKISQKTGSTVLLNHMPEPLACIQEPSIGERPQLPHARFERLMAVPDKEKYRLAFEAGKKVCRPAGQEMMGIIPCALVEVWPVRFTREGLLELVEEVTLTVVSEPSARVASQEKDILRALPPRIVVRRHVVAQDEVVNSELVQKELRRNIAALKKISGQRSRRKSENPEEPGPCAACGVRLSDRDRQFQMG